MAKRSIGDIEKIWSHVEGVKKLSDRIIGLGPIGIGLDGVLAWIPGVGLAYGLGAGALLMAFGLQAKASPATLARMAAYLVADNATDAVPVLGWAVDTVFPGHLMAAKALQKDIESTHWVEANERDSRASGDHDRHVATVKADPTKRRIVYLHD